MPAKKLLLNKERKFQLLFEGHPQPMWVEDPVEGTILEANPAAALLYGYTREQFRGMNLDAVAVSADAGQPASGPLRHRTASGGSIDVEVARHSIAFGGKPAELVVLMDVTDRRKLEDQLRQAQKMESVGMLASGVAHDFNNLLTIISGYSELILNSLEPDDPNHYSAEQILRAGERAAALTRQLLAFSRPQVWQPRILDINKLVAGLSAMLRRMIGEDVDLQLVLRPDLGMVHADPGQIEQVLMNLVVNARDAMPKGGTLLIETANAELDETYAGQHMAVKPGPYALLSVSDSGSGMDEAILAKVFEPFFTTKPSGRGTGLGLSTVFGIVKQSGGNLDVRSTPGRGTSVKVYLPRMDRGAAVEPESTRKAVAAGSETVLLVEDEEIVRRLVRETLVRAGYKVLDTSDPLEAQRLSDGYRGQIQLLVTDLVMPKLGGRDVAQRLRGRRAGLKVLYMSGYAENTMDDASTPVAGAAFIQKPFTPAALTQKVREVLDNGGLTRHARE